MAKKAVKTYRLDWHRKWCEQGKLLKLAEARADDSQKQFNEAREENDRLKKRLDECHESNSAFTENFTRMTIENCELKQDLKHTDDQRRMLERDAEWMNEQYIKQQDALKIYAPFDRVLSRFTAKGPIA
jgi:predicted nuclease with TOPRIM domain